MLTQGINWNNEFSKLNFYKNIYFAKESNANDFLQVSDIMITDVSSIAWEFLAFRKPIIVQIFISMSLLFFIKNLD